MMQLWMMNLVKLLLMAIDRADHLAGLGIIFNALISKD